MLQIRRGCFALLTLLLLQASSGVAMSPAGRKLMAEKVKEMFYHGYNKCARSFAVAVDLTDSLLVCCCSYLTHAFPRECCGYCVARFGTSCPGTQSRRGSELANNLCC